VTWRTATLAVWGWLALVITAAQCYALASRGRAASAGRLLRRAVGHRAARVALVVGWMWLGWHLFAR
jgi:hypothetical protein